MNSASHIHANHTISTMSCIPFLATVLSYVVEWLIYNSHDWYTSTQWIGTNQHHNALKTLSEYSIWIWLHIFNSFDVLWGAIWQHVTQCHQWTPINNSLVMILKSIPIGSIQMPISFISNSERESLCRVSLLTTLSKLNSNSSWAASESNLTKKLIWIYASTSE